MRATRVSDGTSCFRTRDDPKTVVEAKCERLVFPTAVKRESHVAKIELKNKTAEPHHMTIQRPEAPFFLQHTSITVK